MEVTRSAIGLFPADDLVSFVLEAGLDILAILRAAVAFLAHAVSDRAHAAERGTGAGTLTGLAVEDRAGNGASRRSARGFAGGITGHPGLAGARVEIERGGTAGIKIS